MMQTDVSRLLHEAADARDELRVRLQLMEEARIRMPINVELRAVGADGGDVADGDVVAILFEVMLEASKSAQEDLKAIMAQVKAMNAAKRALRELVSEMSKLGAPKSPPCPPACAIDLDAILLVLLTAYSLDLDREMDGLITQVDGDAEMSELTALELQLAMDRRSKMLGALSNILKKIAETQSQIVQNLK